MTMRTLKISLFVSLLLSMVPLRAAEPLASAAPNNFNVLRKPFRFVTWYELTADGQPAGTVVRNRYRPLTEQYEVFNAAGDPVAVATTRLFTQTFGPWGTHLIVQAADGSRLGTVRGVWFTWSRASFRFYDEHDRCVAVAYVDRKAVGCSLVHPQEPMLHVARLLRNNNLSHTDDAWDVSLYSEDGPHILVMQAFAAFITEHQHKFGKG